MSSFEWLTAIRCHSSLLFQSASYLIWRVFASFACCVKMCMCSFVRSENWVENLWRLTNMHQTWIERIMKAKEANEMRTKEHTNDKCQNIASVMHKLCGYFSWWTIAKLKSQTCIGNQNVVNYSKIHETLQPPKQFQRRLTQKLEKRMKDLCSELYIIVFINVQHGNLLHRSNEHIRRAFGWLWCAMTNE